MRGPQCGSYLSSRGRSECLFPRSRWVPDPHRGRVGQQVDMRVQHPCIPGFGRKEYQRADGDKASIVFSRLVLNVFYLLSEAKVLALHPLFSWPTLDLFRVHVVLQFRSRVKFPWNCSKSFSVSCCSLSTTASIGSSSTAI